MRLVVYILFLLICRDSFAQNQKVWIYFNAKDKSTFHPETFFTAAHNERNSRLQLPQYDDYDVPVNTAYINAVGAFCDSITGISRWFNAVCAYVNEENLSQIQALPFVKNIEILAPMELMLMEDKKRLRDLHNGEINLLKGQIKRMGGDLFWKNGITGKGITVAIIDAGFIGYKKNPVLEDINSNNQIVHTYDFIKKRADVDIGSTHGTAVLSCVGGKIDDEYIGCAYDAKFLLYRTEKAFNEKFSEEEKWVMAMEEADRQGADVINTSLGYTGRRYFEKDMDGKKSLLSKAANMANRKGMLLVCSAGNEGDIDWKIICTPADADSALAVGAINPWTGIQASWSSYGPSADWRIKPNVSAYGYVMAAESGEGINMTLGTSFSSPLTAGFAACLRQLLPEVSAFELMKKIEQSSDLHPYFDFAHGYGVPQASWFFEEKPKKDPTFRVEITNDTLTVILADEAFTPAYLQIKNYHFSKEDSTARFVDFKNKKFFKGNHLDDYGFDNTRSSFVFEAEPGYFYYKFHDIDRPARIEEYSVLNVREKKILYITKKEKVHTHCFYYKGYTTCIDF